jgi:hypothetical protein
MAKLFPRRNLVRLRLLEFAAGDIHKKYVPESEFYTNPLLSAGRKAALRKTEGRTIPRYSGITPQIQSAIDVFKQQHTLAVNKEIAGQSHMVKAGLQLRKYGVEIKSDAMNQALESWDQKIRGMRQAHEQKVDEYVEKLGGKPRHKYINPGTRIRGGKVEQTLHPSFLNWSININEKGRHTDYLTKLEKLKAQGHTEPWQGVVDFPETSIGKKPPSKKVPSPVAQLQSRYRKELLSNTAYKGEANPWKGFKSELLTKRTQLRRQMAGELGYEFKGGKLNVTGRRQIQQTERKLRGTIDQPLSPEAWTRIHGARATASRRPYGSTQDIDPSGLLPIGERTIIPGPGHGGEPWKPAKRVGLAGANKGEIATYNQEMTRVESRLKDLTADRVTDRYKQALAIKENLQKRADVNIQAQHPNMRKEEVISRRDRAVNRLLHGTGDPKMANYIHVPPEELNQHAGTIGIKVKHAKDIRTKFRNLLTTGVEEDKIRGEILKEGTPFLPSPPEPPSIHAPAAPSYPHLKRLGVGLGIGAGVVGGAILARRLFQKSKKEQNGKELSSRLREIRFATPPQKPAGGQRVLVAKDRYLKTIKHQDLASAVSNYLRSAGAGAGLGYLLAHKIPPARAAKIGAVGGLAAEAATRAVTARTKDPYGERPWQAKEVDKAPWEAGALAATGIVAKRRLPKLWKSVTSFDVKDKPHPSALHDIATGSIEGGLGVLATDKLIKKLVPSGSGLGRKLAIGAGVGGLATGAVGAILSRIPFRRKPNDTTQLRSKLKLIEFAPLTEDERNERADYRRWSGRRLKARGEDIYQWGGRGYRTARDIKDIIRGQGSLDSRGRQRKREWQKPWAFKALALGGIGLGLGGLAASRFGKGGGSILQSWRSTGPGKFLSGVRGDWEAMTGRTGQPTFTEQLASHKAAEAEKVAAKMAERKRVKDRLGMKSKLRLIEFQHPYRDYDDDYWDARGLSRNQAVVTGPYGRRQHRRKKRLDETKAFRETAGGIGIIGSAAGALLLGRRWGLRSAAHDVPHELPHILPSAAGHAAPHVQGELFPHQSELPAAWIDPETGHLRKRAVNFSSKRSAIRFEEKKRDYATPIVGTTAGAGGFFAGGMYRGRKLQPGEDLTGRRITRPHSLHPLLQHEGIGISSGLVAHLHHTPKMGEKGIVTVETPEKFARGSQIRVLDKTIDKGAAERAATEIGKTVPYSLFYKNCQRFGICSRTGKASIVPRQLKTALAVGGIAGVTGAGITKAVQYNRRKKQFTARDGSIIRFEEQKKGHPYLRSGVKIGATAAGLGALKLGGSLIPATASLARISGPELIRGTGRTSKLLRGFIKPKVDPNFEGKMVFNYIDAAQKALNTGVKGRAAGAFLQAGLEHPESLIGKLSNKVTGSPFQREHFQRFRAGPIQALDHWHQEHKWILENKIKKGVKWAGDPENPRSLPHFEEGGQRAKTQIYQRLWHHGQNEREALQHVASSSTDPVIQNYFKEMYGSKRRVIGQYGKESLAASAGLSAVGAGTIAAANWPRKKQSNGQVRRLSSKRDKLIEFNEPRRSYGTVAKDALVGGVTSAVGTAGLLAGTGLALKGKAPALAKMLSTAAGQHIKVFNPLHTGPMLRSLPEASRLFGKQLRGVKEVERLATSGGIPNLEQVGEAVQRTGIDPTKDISDIAAFNKRWGRTPGESMEKSVGLLSGMAATGVGVAGGAALSKGWKKERQNNPPKNFGLTSGHLTSKLDDLIQFSLFQPKKKDQSTPEHLPVSEGEILDYVEQSHQARRAGRHTDIRIGDEARGMYSWATKKQLPEEGQKIQLHPQAIHPAHYNTFQGEIPSGYGAGSVTTQHLGKALVTRSDPEQTNITVATKRGSHRLALLNTKLGKLLVREKTPEVEAVKPKMKTVQPEDAEDAFKKLPEGTVVQPKVDGALVFVSTKGGEPEIFSYRKSKHTGKQILHTERFFKGRPRLDIPKEHQRTFMGELFGLRKGKAIPPQELGGILNAHIGKSLQQQESRGIKLKVMPVDLADREGTYPERLAKLQETVAHLPSDKFELPEMSTTPKEHLSLFRKIRAGKHPLTVEGVVAHPPEGKPIRIKNVEESDVKIHSLFPGKGKYAGSYGGFHYRTPSGDTGKVGTGFTDATRRELPQYIGRYARIRHQGKFKDTGKYRAPSLIAIHESKN